MQQILIVLALISFALGAMSPTGIPVNWQNLGLALLTATLLF